ncbi:MAG: c-type cytochrome [Hyphomicrobiales bacterium]|nr:c-type cytochrome [Hyphomicrobiales bacterium]
MRPLTAIAIVIAALALALALVLPSGRKADGGQVAQAAAGDRVQGDAATGARAAREWCTGCHVVAADGAGADTAPAFSAIANRPGATAGGLRAFLTAPHGRMPDFQLSRPHIDDLAAYIWSLRGQ